MATGECVDLDGNTHPEHDMPNDPDDTVCDRCGLDPDEEEEQDAARYDVYGEYIPTDEENALEDAIEEGEDEDEYWNV